MSSIAASGWLVVRRAGGLWAVRPGELTELRGERPPRLELRDGTTLCVDEVLTLAAGLEPRPFPRVAGRFFPAAVHGLAVWRQRPVVLLEPGAPPPICLGSHDSTNHERGVHGEATR